MSLRLYRAFSSELTKIATGLNDAGIRQAIAEKKGKDFLPGGELPSNGPMPKTAAFSSMLASQVGDSSPIGKAKRKKPGKYQEGRDWAATGLKGATGGVAAAGLGHALMGIKELPLSRLRAGAGLGTAIAIGDRAYRYHAEKQKTAMVSPTPGPLTSPGTALSAARKTGGFKSSVVHNLNTPHKAVQIGQKFRLP